MSDAETGTGLSTLKKGRGYRVGELNYNQLYKELKDILTEDIYNIPIIETTDEYKDFKFSDKAGVLYAVNPGDCQIIGYLNSIKRTPEEFIPTIIYLYLYGLEEFNPDFCKECLMTAKDIVKDISDYHYNCRYQELAPLYLFGSDADKYSKCLDTHGKIVRGILSEKELAEYIYIHMEDLNDNCSMYIYPEEMKSENIQKASEDFFKKHSFF